MFHKIYKNQVENSLLANLVTHLVFLANWEGVEVWEGVVQHQYHRLARSQKGT